MELQVQTRDKFGKSVKALRAQGLIPAELYGRGIGNIHLAVPVKDFKKVFKSAGESTMINVVINGEKRPALIYGIATDPVSDDILNVDFYQVRLDEKIRIKVPLVFIGESEGVKNGGILVKALQEIEIEALPGNIPSSLEVDLAKLTEIGQSIYVKNLKIPADVKVLVALETVAATVIEPVSEEEEAAQSQTVDVSAIKSETEEKKAGREEKAATKEEASPEAK
ncbi:MAG: 50S ribosomal protein L25 [Patescibacteria group bacterium]